MKMYMTLQVMSKSCACRFLYDISTSVDDITKLENALETRIEFKTELCFRRKNGEKRFLETAINVDKHIFRGEEYLLIVRIFLGPNTTTSLFPGF